jgi:hypothetical protein
MQLIHYNTIFTLFISESSSCKLAYKVTLLIFLLEVRGLNSDRNRDYISLVVSWFLQSLQANTAIVPPISSQPLLFTSFQIH